MTNLIILKDVPKRYSEIISTFKLDFNDGLNSLEEVINDNAPFQLEDCIVDGDWLIPINNNIQGFNIKILNTEKLFLKLLELSIWLHQEIDKVEDKEVNFLAMEKFFYECSKCSPSYNSVTVNYIDARGVYMDIFKKLVIQTFLKKQLDQDEPLSKSKMRRLLIQLGENK